MCSFLIRELGEKEFNFFHFPECKETKPGDFVLNYFLGKYKGLKASNFKLFTGNTKFQLRYLNSVAIITDTLEVILDTSENHKVKLTCELIESEAIANPLLLNEDLQCQFTTNIMI